MVKVPENGARFVCRLCRAENCSNETRVENICSSCYIVLQQFWELRATLSSAQKKRYKELHGFDLDGIPSNGQTDGDVAHIHNVPGNKDTGYLPDPMEFLNPTSYDLDVNGAIKPNIIMGRNLHNYKTIQVSCTLCTFFGSYTRLKKHFKTMHPFEEIGYQCQFCMATKWKSTIYGCYGHLCTHFPYLKRW